MAKLNAYPITFVFFCFNFLANSAEFLKENDSIFKQSTPSSDTLQEISDIVDPSVHIHEHHDKWIAAFKKAAPDNSQEHIQAFNQSIVPGAYHSPIKSGNNTYYCLKGISPKKTPRRKQNISRLKQGKRPVLVIKGQVIPYEMHHVGQENDHTSIVMLPTYLHKGESKYFHTRKGPSKINRSKFAGQKQGIWKELGGKFEKQQKRRLQKFKGLDKL